MVVDRLVVAVLLVPPYMVGEVELRLDRQRPALVQGFRLVVCLAVAFLPSPQNYVAGEVQLRLDRQQLMAIHAVCLVFVVRMVCLAVVVLLAPKDYMAGEMGLRQDRLLD